MKVLFVSMFAFFGALLVPAMFFPSLHSVAITLGGIAFTWSLLLAIGVGFCGLGLSAKG